LKLASLSDYLLLRINRSSAKAGRARARRQAAAKAAQRAPKNAKPGSERMPVNRQIYQLIREAILAHTLPAGCNCRPRATWPGAGHLAQYGDLCL
jgi:GntR family transcriptional regulator/MocR family aminotransferase